MHMVAEASVQDLWLTSRLPYGVGRQPSGPCNFLRTLALPKDVEHWSLTTLREKLIKIEAKVSRHGRYITFQLAEIAM